MERRELGIYVAVVILIITMFSAITITLVEKWQEYAQENLELKERIAELEHQLDAVTVENVPEVKGVESVGETPAPSANVEPCDVPSAPATEDESAVCVDSAAVVDYSNAPPDANPVRGYWQNEVWEPQEEMRQRIQAYCESKGFHVSMDDIRHFCSLAWSGGYDPRIWVILAQEESTFGRGASNYFGYCGAASDPVWGVLSGSLRQQVEALDYRLRTYYSQYVDIGIPAEVFWFHHEGEPVNGRDVFAEKYVHDCTVYLGRI